MSMTEEATYVSKTTSSLLYNTKPSLIESIEERRVDRLMPLEKNSGFKAGETLTLIYSNDQLIDPQSISLQFQLRGRLVGDTSTTATTNGNINVISGSDIFRKCSIYYNDVLVEEYDHANYWTNAFLAYSANRSWYETEGHALMGTVPRYVADSAAVDTTSKLVNVLDPIKSGTDNKQYFTVPLALVCPFLRNKFHLPLFGGKLRIVFVLAADKDVICKATATTDIYRLDSVSSMYDTIILTPAYRQALIAQLRTPEGIRIPFTSYNTLDVPAQSGKVNQLRFQFNLVNAMSLHMLHDPTPVKGSAITNYCYVSHSFPCPSTDDSKVDASNTTAFTRLDVYCGTKRFTPNDGIKTFSELYESAEKCVNSLCDISGSGIVNRIMQQDPYAENATFTSCKAGLCLFSVNLEKSTESDESLINSGISSAQGLNQFDVRAEFPNDVLDTSTWHVNIVHKASLKINSSGTSVDK